MVPQLEIAVSNVSQGSPAFKQGMSIAAERAVDPISRRRKDFPSYDVSESCEE
jgi:hypothetical protein